VATLGVPLDSVVGSQTNPVGQGAVLPLLLGKRALCSEGLLGRLCVCVQIGKQTQTVGGEKQSIIVTTFDAVNTTSEQNTTNSQKFSSSETPWPFFLADGFPTHQGSDQYA